MASAKRFDLAQSIGMLGVVVSLLFVGWEIRQNTQVARAAAVQATIEQIIEWQTDVALNDDWIRIIDFLNTGGSYAELAPVDQQRYGWVVSATVRIMENRFRQMQLGVISSEDLGVGGGTANPNWFRSDHFISYWTEVDRTRSWTPDFLEFFEGEVLGLR
ncbi:MAG: hypothetical protein R3323_06265 [Wenzhouxiangellaceae bacterium]|nr:hypothetical protein [Wenzhouxiangellaceae bacterium]